MSEPWRARAARPGAEPQEGEDSRTADAGEWFLTGTAASERRLRDEVAAATELVVDFARRPARVPGSAAGLREAVAGFELFPATGTGLKVWSEVADVITDHAVNVSSPRYGAHYLAPPLIPALVAELVVGALNQSLDSFDQAPSATVAETAVVSLVCGELGLDGGDGIFTPGASASNLMGLLLARERAARAGTDLRVVCSDEAHHSVALAARVLGLPADAVVTVACDRGGAIDLAALRRVLDDPPGGGGADRPAPATAVVVTVGTTDRGARDPLAAVAGLARCHGAWLHVDAAASGALTLSRRYRHEVADLARCDSLALDFHKLGWQPVPSGLFVVRHRRSLELIRHHADYLNPAGEADDVNLAWKSLQTTRRFDALKLAVTLRSLGRDGFDALITAQQRAVELVRGHVAAAPDLELVGAGLHTVRFRFTGEPPLPAARADRLNDALRRSLAADGGIVMGRSTAGGRPSLKLQLLNPALGEEAAARLVADIVARGRDLIAGDG